VVQEFLKPEMGGSSANLTGMVTNIIFNISSASNTWSLGELKGFQEKAGLTPCKVSKFGLQLPSFLQVCARNLAKEVIFWDKLIKGKLVIEFGREHSLPHHMAGISSLLKNNVAWPHHIR
jgi:hypothetical protein